MDLEHAIDEVHDPVVANSVAGIRGGLSPTGDAQSGVCDLDDEHRAGRVLSEVIARRTGDDRNIRFRLGPVVEGDGQLLTDDPPSAERCAQRVGNEPDRCRMRGVLRFLDEQKPVEQFDRIIFVEQPVLDQAPVLDTGSASRLQSIRPLHRTRG